MNPIRLTALHRSIGLALLCAGFLLVNAWSKPFRVTSTVVCPPLAPAEPIPSIESDIAPMLEAALNDCGRSWSEEDRKRAVKGIAAVVKRHHFSPAFVLSVIQTESSFQPDAVSPKGAVGLTQLLPATARFAAALIPVETPTRESLTDPALNIRIGFAYLAWLKRKYGSLDAALVVYNGGPQLLRNRAPDGPLPCAAYRKEVRRGELQLAQRVYSPR